MNRGRLSGALIACLGLGAADVAALNLAVLPGLRERASGTSTAPTTAPTTAPAPAPVVTAMTMEPPSPPPAAEMAPLPAPQPAPAPQPQPAPQAQPAPSATPADDAVAIVEFEKDSHRVGLRATWTLHKLALRLRGGEPEVLLVGHADATGSPEINERLSALRAQSVARRLAELGVPRDRLRVEARGDREPRAAGNDRRVEIFIGGSR